MGYPFQKTGQIGQQRPGLAIGRDKSWQGSVKPGQPIRTVQRPTLSDGLFTPAFIGENIYCVVGSPTYPAIINYYDFIYADGSYRAFGNAPNLQVGWHHPDGSFSGGSGPDNPKINWGRGQWEWNRTMFIEFSGGIGITPNLGGGSIFEDTRTITDGRTANINLYDEKGNVVKSAQAVWGYSIIAKNWCAGCAQYATVDGWNCQYAFDANGPVDHFCGIEVTQSGGPPPDPDIPYCGIAVGSSWVLDMLSTATNYNQDYQHVPASVSWVPQDMDTSTEWSAAQFPTPGYSGAYVSKYAQKYIGAGGYIVPLSSQEMSTPTHRVFLPVPPPQPFSSSSSSSSSDEGGGDESESTTHG